MHDRPTWKLEGRDRPATFATDVIDFDRATAAFIDQPGSYRMRDMNEVLKQLASYFLEVAHPALVELACHARAGTVAPPPW